MTQMGGGAINRWGVSFPWTGARAGRDQSQQESSEGGEGGEGTHAYMSTPSASPIPINQSIPLGVELVCV